MKKNMKKIISLILTIAVLVTGSTVFVSADDGEAADNSALISVTNVANGFLEIVFERFGSLFPNDFISVEEYYAGESENFYEGNEVFLDAPAQDAKWYLGFGKASIVPENLINGEKSYYTGGYFTQVVDGVFDDQGVNAVAMNDNSGRGTVIMAAVDGVGVTNADVRAIRAEAERKISEQGVDSDIVAININSTHAHTVIDTQGFGLKDLLLGIVRNIASRFTPYVEAGRSIDSEFYDYMIDGASDAIAEAYMNMESGELYYFETAGIGRSERNGNYPDDEYDYLYNKRYNLEGYQHVIACFKFVPDNAQSAPTVFANLGGHPTTINRATKLLSADYPHYIETKLNEAGMNFMFIQGAQSPISVSAGNVKTEEILAEVEAEIAEDARIEDYAQPKKLGYEFARLIVEAQDNATEVAPVLNVKMAEVTVPLEFGLLELGAVSGLLGMTTVTDASAPSGYSVISEVGYVELGSDIAVVTVPGELVPQLVYGNVVDKTQSYLGTDWEYEATASVIGEDKTVLVMGLCNDAIGYIVPDNDYAPFIADTIWNNDFGVSLFGEYHSHYEEMLSTGSRAGSTIIGALNELVKDSK